MEGRTRPFGFGAVIMGVVILSLVLGQTVVEAKSCCRSTTARNCYNVCRLPGTPRDVCAKACDCKIIDGKCKPPYDRTTLESSEDIAATQYHYCKLGCASSNMCNSFKNLQNSGPVVAGEEVVDVAAAVEQCTDACSAFCTKGSAVALESA